jgi:hypothetical protein
MPTFFSVRDAMLLPVFSMGGEFASRVAQSQTGRHYGTDIVVNAWNLVEGLRQMR